MLKALLWSLTWQQYPKVILLQCFVARGGGGYVLVDKSNFKDVRKRGFKTTSIAANTKTKLVRLQESKVNQWPI